MPLVWYILGGGCFAVAIALAVLFLITLYQNSKIRVPPLKPKACPKCGGTEHAHKEGGLRDTWADDGTWTGCGTFAYGVCKQCGSRWGQIDDLPTYVPSDEEWQDQTEMGRAETARRIEQEKDKEGEAWFQQWAEKKRREGKRGISDIDI